MKIGTPAIVAMLSLLLMAQQEAPLRQPGRFMAVSTGTLSGNISGDASAQTFGQHKRELYFLLDSELMMKSNKMLSITISMPAVNGNSRVSLNATNTLVVVHNLITHQHQTIDVAGTLECNGKMLLKGTLKIESKTPAHPLSLTGSFENAPVLSALH